MIDSSKIARRVEQDNPNIKNAYQKITQLKIGNRKGIPEIASFASAVVRTIRAMHKEEVQFWQEMRDEIVNETKGK